MSRRATIGVIVAVAGLCRATASAQVPAGPEFRVNTFTTYDQVADRQFLASGPSDEYTVVWQSPQDGSSFGVYAQRFARDGNRVGAEFRVNTMTALSQERPSVAIDGRGGFVVVWSSDAQDGNQQGVFGQRYHASGAPNGLEFQVNTYITSSQGAPTPAANPDGSFVVTWTSFGQDGSSFGIFGQRYDPSGARVGSEFQVNTYVTGEQVLSSVDADASGRFVVVWRSRFQDGSAYGVFGQRFDANGARLGLEFRVNSNVAGDQSSPMVAVHDGGAFVVVWHDRDIGINRGIRGQRFDAQGGTIGLEFAVNTYTTGFHSFPDVATDAEGNFIATWTNSGQDGDQEGVFGQRFDASGAKRGAEFSINTFTMFDQDVPAAAADSVGNFVVAWNSFNQDGSYRGIFGQRFGGLLPEFLRVDAAGNAVFEAGEAASINPGWRNATGATQAFGGAVSAFTGPGAPSNPVYSVPDATASYGTVANAAVGDCLAVGDCYVAQTTVPSSRPVAHWDAAFREDILPATQGQTKTWTLHVGESFTDVPPSSGFYRFTETILHKNVTGGCTATTYCPLNSTTREQMAVFVLVSKEPPGYLPPACVPPNLFTDVSEASPFCRWIEELANRGVVGGCGGGNYCPSLSATREQMAVFVLRTLDPTLNPPACVPPNLFADVPETSPFCEWIEELANRGVVTGCGGGNYCPTADVSREQMSVFLAVTFGLILYGP